MSELRSPHDEPDFTARLFQLPVLQGGLPRHAETEAERRDQPLRLQKLQEDGTPVVGQPIQFHELDGTARQGAATGRALAMFARNRALDGRGVLHELKLRWTHQAS